VTPKITIELLETACQVQYQYAGLELDLADGANVALAAEYRSRVARTELYISVRFCYRGVMTTIRAEEVRIPRHAREAVARHERVVVVNRERPTFIIMHPDDTAADSLTARRGRPLREALGLLADAALPDPGFADDMEAVLADVGPAPGDPWARS
jgi:hypothetical protein